MFYCILENSIFHYFWKQYSIMSVWQICLCYSIYILPDCLCVSLFYQPLREVYKSLILLWSIYFSFHFISFFLFWSCITGCIQIKIVTSLDRLITFIIYKCPSLSLVTLLPLKSTLPHLTLYSYVTFLLVHANKIYTFLFFYFQTFYVLVFLRGFITILKYDLHAIHFIHLRYESQ